jgi:hypothetical protein
MLSPYPAACGVIVDSKQGKFLEACFVEISAFTPVILRSFLRGCSLKEVYLGPDAKELYSFILIEGV